MIGDCHHNPAPWGISDDHSTSAAERGSGYGDGLQGYTDGDGGVATLKRPYVFGDGYYHGDGKGDSNGKRQAPYNYGRGKGVVYDPLCTNDGDVVSSLCAVAQIIGDQEQLEGDT